MFPDANDPSVDWGTLTCAEFIALCTEYLEDVLPEAERTRFDHHLTVCEGCVNWLEQIRQTIEMMGSIDESMVEPEILEGLYSAFRDWKAASPGT